MKAHIATESDSSLDDTKLDIKKFAFDRSSKVKHISSTVTSRAPSMTRQDSSSSIKAKAVAKAAHAVGHIPDRDLARVLNCVCCGLTWTTRKSVLQKRKHIQSCSRNHKLTSETVSGLLMAEIGRSPLTGKKSKEIAKLVVSEKEEAPRTLLADAVVNDATGKQRGRRPPVIETVKSVEDTRSDIIARARVFLGDKDRRPVSQSGSTLDQFVGHNEVLSAHPPSTQPFGESSLARVFQPHRPREPPSPTQAYIPTLATAVSPPSTQSFGQSALARMFQPRPRGVRPAVGPNVDNTVAGKQPFTREVQELSSDSEEENIRFSASGSPGRESSNRHRPVSTINCGHPTRTEACSHLRCITAQTNSIQSLT